ncbi:hypothetical protein MXD81_06175 [Microbacteriaceae bacterium K1510]|nr:hypothetical protein [Microbacteriaceae bacterium K1510]
MTDQSLWQSQTADAAYEFGLRCAILVAQNPHTLAAPLNDLINTLMTELWDRNFSMTEIRAALEAAVKDMPRYTGGQERRSPTSNELATTDWLPIKSR